MSENSKISLSLEENAHAFLNEAVEKALQATEDLRHWQFAILHLVQSLELSLKNLLKNVNEVLVYENVENPKHTVSITKAIQRLEQPLIKGIHFGDEEKSKIFKAIDLRNKITHADFEFSKSYAQKKFFELFAFIVYFQSRYLHTEIEGIISAEHLESLMAIRASRLELLNKARARIEDENIDADFIWECPNCTEDVFVIENSIDTCYLCRQVEAVSECKHCNDFYFDHEMESIEEDIDYGFEEGRAFIHNTYGYSDFQACPNCLPNIREDIHNQRTENDHWHMMEEEAYTRR